MANSSRANKYAWLPLDMQPEKHTSVHVVSVTANPIVTKLYRFGIFQTN
jgi:hypothetical protein